MSAQMPQFQDRMIRLLAEQLGVDAEELRPEQTFRELGVDSLALVELVVAVENDLDLGFPAELDGVSRESTLGEACSVLEALAVPGRTPAGPAGGEARVEG
ncbi:acyl carrier protein [Streptomyces sulphureus]|uniref:acyl carrier protein n=1 Tax=Streptomyces sulphureus TaxID=47758 RepID=UPI00037E55AC|nr:acyl carrier protein [Streptomyces sulphureus]